MIAPDINEARPAGKVICRGRLAAGAGSGLSLAVLASQLATPCLAQEALRNSLASQSPGQSQTTPGSQFYNFKSGDFRLQTIPSLGLDYNDNIRATRSAKQDDFILRPLLQLNASYPFTQKNFLTVNLGFGYDKYFDQDELSAWRVQSGSAISFDVFVKDFAFNLHDRLSYSRDSSQEAAVAGTADFGNFVNTAGLSVAYSLRKATLSAGYDHQNVISIKSTFNSQDHAAEMFFGRVSFEINPALQAGFEGTAAFTTYDQSTLNDNSVYSAGVFATWQPGSAFCISPRVGYSISQFEESATTIRTKDLGSYYLGLTAAHDITEAFSYAVSAGRDTRLGVQSDAIEQIYVRPTITWKAFKRASIQFGFSYEHGKQGAGNLAGGLVEEYDWLGATIGTSYQIMEKLSVGINYRLTVRSSDLVARDYTQNMVGILFTYLPR